MKFYFLLMTWVPLASFAAAPAAADSVHHRPITLDEAILLARENVNIARQNLANAEKLHEVAKAKRRMGQISENDLLQLELNVLDARSTLTSNESSLKSNMFALRSFLALGEDEELEPVVPDSVPDVLLNYDEVLDKALIRPGKEKKKAPSRSKKAAPPPEEHAAPAAVRQ